MIVNKMQDECTQSGAGARGGLAIATQCNKQFLGDIQ